MGNAGYQALLSRALTLAGSKVPALNTVRVNSAGILEGVEKLPAHLDADKLSEARPGGVHFAFKQFFGGRAGRSSGASPFDHNGGNCAKEPQQALRGQDVRGDILITLDEVLKGAMRAISVRRTNARTGQEETETYQVRIPAKIDWIHGIPLVLIGAERFVAEFVPVRQCAQMDDGFHARKCKVLVCHGADDPFESTQDMAAFKKITETRALKLEIIFISPRSLSGGPPSGSARRRADSPPIFQLAPNWSYFLRLSGWLKT
jgi:hypothetical protein